MYDELKLQLVVRGMPAESVRLGHCFSVGEILQQRRIGRNQHANVDAQRGRGTFEGSIEALRRLNEVGYGQRPALRLDLVYNPGVAFGTGHREGVHQRLGRFGGGGQRQCAAQGLHLPQPVFGVAALGQARGQQGLVE